MKKISAFLCLCVFVFAQPSIDDLLENQSDQTTDQAERSQTQEDFLLEKQLPQIKDRDATQTQQEQAVDLFGIEKKDPQEMQNELIEQDLIPQEVQKPKEVLGVNPSTQEVPQIPKAQEDKEAQAPKEINKPHSSSNNPVNSDFFNQGKQSREKFQAINLQYLRDKITQCEEKEDQSACFEVGMLFYQGRSVYGQKLQQALYFFDRSCDEKKGLGCYEAGIISANSQAYQHSFIFLEKSCQSGDLRGCKNLGILYYNGWGTPKNIYKATEIFNLGCKKGDKLSCQKFYLALGNAYQESLNYSGAKKNYKQACELGEVQACQKMEEIIMLERENQRKNFR